VIRYALACEQGHEFESWFAGSDAYEKQRKRRLVACPSCGSTKIDKLLMAPQVKRTDRQKGAPSAPPASPAPASAEAAGASENTPIAIMSEQEREIRTKLRELRELVTRNADYVGQKFAEEARRMHYGELEHRSIYGEASPEEAKALNEEGIEFHPLPILPDERN
jgi:hypothetical protein